MPRYNYFYNKNFMCHKNPTGILTQKFLQRTLSTASTETIKLEKSVPEFCNIMFGYSDYFGKYFFYFIDNTQQKNLITLNFRWKKWQRKYKIYVNSLNLVHRKQEIKRLFIRVLSINLYSPNRLGDSSKCLNVFLINANCVFFLRLYPTAK